MQNSYFQISIIQKLFIFALVLISKTAIISQELSFPQTGFTSLSDAVEKPNFILIVADDLGYGDLGFTGSTQIKTPFIDELARTGAICTQGYVSSAVCSPSRAGLLTGKNQVRFGYDNNLAENQKGFDPDFGGLPVEEKTIADHLSNLGYVTGLIGKWHLGSKDQFHPLNRGFDEFWGYLGGGHDYFTSSEDGKGYMSPIICNYKEPSPITYITDDKGDECVDFVARHKDHPFFLYASFNAPHTPMQALEEDLALYRDIQDEERRTYAAMVHRLDVNIGKILRTLDSLNLRENTLIAFISDNGGPTDANASLNAPLKGNKGILFEGGIRVPFVLNWKGRIPEGSVYEKPVISLDFLPTFYEVGGGTISESMDLDGVNIIPHLLGENSESPHEEIYWRFTISAAILDGQWKLIRLPDRLPMLYNLNEDISEQRDVSMEHLDITKRLLKKLGTWDVHLPHPLFLEGAIWKHRQLDLYDRAYQLTQPN